MARRQRSSVMEDLLEMLINAASQIPWWLTLPVALLLFYFIPYIHTPDINLQEPTGLAAPLIATMLKAFFRIAIPSALVIGAILNVYSSLKTASLFESIKKNGAQQTIKDLSWQDFEFLLTEWFKKQGFAAELVGGGGADGGIDIKLQKNGELYLVQCKHYKASKVSVQTVRELLGVMTAESAVGGYVITSGKFTKDATNFAKGKNIELIDGAKLTKILDTNQLANKTPDVHTCPTCGSALVERKGKYGRFYGCSTYPKCKYTQTVD